MMMGPVGHSVTPGTALYIRQERMDNEQMMLDARLEERWIKVEGIDQQEMGGIRTRLTYKRAGGVPSGRS